MRAGLIQIRAFFNAEEVPRWFGLSLVVSYLFGLGAVAYLGISTTRGLAAKEYESSSRYAVTALVSRLSEIDGSASMRQLSRQHALYEFSSHMKVDTVRLINRDRKIIASINEDELGQIFVDDSSDVNWPKAMTIASVDSKVLGMPVSVIRAPVYTSHLMATKSSVEKHGSSDMPTSATQAGDKTENERDSTDLLLDIRLLPFEHSATMISTHADTVIVVLVVLGVLFVSYRRLRVQMRSVTRIGERLNSNHSHIEENLGTLRINDAVDIVTHAWNELVDLAQSCASAADKHKANDELACVLKRSQGGALADALNSVSDGIVYIADVDRIQYINANAQRLLGISWDEDSNHSLQEQQLAGIGEKVRDLALDSQTTEGTYRSRSENIKDGQPDDDEASSYRVSIQPMRKSTAGNGCVITIRDVSQQLRTDRAREDFVTQVTHELRTPLTNIRAYAETLSSGMFDDPKVITECYNVITKETRRLSRLIEDILSVSQLEVGSIALSINDVDIKALVSDSVRDIRGLAEEKNIDLQIVVPAKMETMSADRDKLSVVLNNLLGNAIKYTPADGVVVVACQQTEDAIMITVKDNGMGIDAKDHARIFEKFQRVDDPEVRTITGTGVGLYTAREMVRKHGGEITVMSEKGNGSTFVVKLPHQVSRATALTVTKEL